jgi:hypothetical protein
MSMMIADLSATVFVEVGFVALQVYWPAYLHMVEPKAD